MDSDTGHENGGSAVSEVADDSVAAIDRARRQRLVFLAVGLVAAAVGIGAASFFFRTDPSQLLSEATALVNEAAALEAGDERTRRARRAERLLRRYLERSRDAVSQAPLLLASALVLQHEDLASTPSQTDMEIQLLLNMIDPRSCATEHLVRGASILVEAGRGGEAAFLADAALRRDDHREEVLCVASRICLEHGASTEALELCREWSRLAPRDPRPLATMGAIHQERSETDQLIRVDRLLLDLAPDNSREIRLRLLDNLIATGEAAEAREQYNLLREAGTPSLRSDMAEAGLLYLEADFERASECVRKILETDAQNCVALKIRGKIQLEQLQASDAITTFRRLVELAPDDYEGHYLLGQAYAQSGDMEQAQRHLRIHREILNF